jgi:hypothetical protein
MDVVKAIGKYIGEKIIKERIKWQRKNPVLL